MSSMKVSCRLALNRILVKVDLELTFRLSGQYIIELVSFSMWVIGSVCDSLYERFSYKSCEEGSNERTRSCERKRHQFTECPLWGVDDGTQASFPSQRLKSTIGTTGPVRFSSWHLGVPCSFSVCSRFKSVHSTLSCKFRLCRSLRANISSVVVGLPSFSHVSLA